MGELTPYWSKHWHIRKAKGSASQYQCSNCDAQARDWAQIHDTDGTNPQTDFMPMCRKCHIAYDGHAHTQWETKKLRGYKQGEAQRTASSERQKKYQASKTPEERSEMIKRGWETRRKNAKS